jgi:ParB family chromosome partitioning protein
MAKPQRRSPILGAVSNMIGAASDTLVTDSSRFRHSFEVALESITADPTQARKHFDADEIAALATTMREQGQLQPILVRRDPTLRNRWVIIAGERRYRAARLNGWTSLLAIEHGGDPEIAALIENLQRVDLSSLEEARGLKRLITDKNWTQDRAAAALGKTKSDISATLRILSLPSHLLEQVLTSEPQTPKNVLVELARVEDLASLQALAALAGTGGLTIRAIRAARSAPIARQPTKQTGWRMQGVAQATRCLQEARNERHQLDEKDRQALRVLRDEIEILLQE